MWLLFDLARISMALILFDVSLALNSAWRIAANLWTFGP